MLLSETTGDETLRYYYDSTGKVTSFSYKKGEAEEENYFYVRNMQGDITAIYRSSDSKLIGTYEYDLWGKFISVTEAEEGIDTHNILHKNPFRYRSYYYDEETGYYCLSARYYNPEVRRFLNTDSLSALMIATTDVGCKNLFVYAENNPVVFKVSTGNFLDTIFDIASLVGSIVDVCSNPLDPWAWAGLAGDTLDLIPGVNGVGEGTKALSATAKGSKYIDDVIDGGLDVASDATEMVLEVGTKCAKDSDTLLPMNLQYFAEKGVDTKKYTPDQQAVIELAKEAKKAGEASNVWHFHIGKTGHIPITGDVSSLTGVKK